MKKETPGDRLRARRKELQLTQKALAAKVGVSHVAISQWEKDETVPRGENLLRVAEALGCAPAYIVDGEGQIFQLSPPPAAFHSLPVLSYAQAAKWMNENALRQGIDNVEFIQSNIPLSDAAFALIIRGNAMDPELREGDCAIFDPAISPLPGDFVVAVCGEETLFAKYRPRGNVGGEARFELVPLNEDYPTVCSHQTPVRITGTLVEQRRYRKRDA